MGIGAKNGRQGFHVGKEQDGENKGFMWAITGGVKITKEVQDSEGTEDDDVGVDHGEIEWGDSRNHGVEGENTTVKPGTEKIQE